MPSCVWSPRVDRRAWDALAPRFEDGVYDIAAIDSRGVLSDLVARVRPRRSRDTLIDLGCGIGTFVQEHGARFANVVALDFSPAMIARAKQRLAQMRHIEWICSDIPRAADMLSERGDLTVCLNVITSTSPRKRAAIWRAVWRVTKPGGWALVVIPALESARMLASFDARVRVDADGASGLVEVEGGRQKYYARGELERIARRHAFEAATVEVVGYPWSEEAMARPRAAEQTPFDWALLARRPLRGN